VGAGRFARIGIPSPEIMAHFVGVVEVVAGALILVGLATRPAAVVLLVDILLPSSPRSPLLWRATAVSTNVGFWSMQAESRTDFAMLMALLFIIVAGPGPLSVDARLAKRGL
jgi:uncharacterized membrane protein YphA (DoxX/SURF4 family)